MAKHRTIPQKLGADNAQKEHVLSKKKNKQKNKTVTPFRKKKKSQRYGQSTQANFLKIKKLKDYNVMKRNFSGLRIMKDEIREEIRKMKLDKATRTDSISVKF